MPTVRVPRSGLLLRVLLSSYLLARAVLLLRLLSHERFRRGAGHGLQPPLPPLSLRPHGESRGACHARGLRVALQRCLQVHVGDRRGARALRRRAHALPPPTPPPPQLRQPLAA